MSYTSNNSKNFAPVGVFVVVALLIASLFVTNISVNCGGTDTALNFVSRVYAHDNEEVAQVIHMKRTGYDPQNITINVGDSVEFENIDTVALWPASNIHPTHEIYSEFDPKKEIQPGESWTFKFDEPGQWMYHDHEYPKVTGKIIVEGDGEVAGEQTKSSNIFTDFVCGILGKKSSKDETSEYKYNSGVAEDSEEIFNDEDELYSYIKKYGTQQAMSQLYQLSAKYGDCHEVAHIAGRISYEIYGNDVFQNCSADCHSGCYHGGTEAYFKENGTANIEEDLKIICSSDLNPFFSHQCFHGVGHGLMAWRDYELYEALKDCETLDKGIESCYSGVFMENIVGGLSEAQGHYSKYLNDDPHYPCDAVESKYKSSCYLLQTSRMIRIFNSDFKKIAETCAELTDSNLRNICFGSMGRDASGISFKDPQKSIALCQNATDTADQQACFYGAVQDTFWTPDGQDTALKFCKMLNPGEQQLGCYTIIFNRATMVITGEAGMKSFCGKVTTDYKDLCEDITGLN